MSVHQELSRVEVRDNCVADLDPDQAAILRRYAGATLQQWRDLGVTVASGPAHGEMAADDQLDKAPVFSLSGIGEAKCQLHAGNCMGVLRLRDGERQVQVEIRSRFDPGREQYFLNYLLQKVFAGCLLDQPIDAGRDSAWDMLLAIVFRDRLLQAAGYGLFRQYRTFEHNDMRYRGQLDLDRHLQRNVPFRGAAAYRTHEITFDNEVNHLLRHALARIERKWPGLLRGNGEVSEVRLELQQQTPTWRPAAVKDCLLASRRPVRHPYFRGHYEPLRKLSRSILRGEGASLYSSEQDVEGILFDGAWLWEKYVWTLLKHLGYDHPDSRTGNGAWRVVGEAFIPDFFRTSPAPVVLDAKYTTASQRQKQVSQVLAYMYMIRAQRGGVVRPSPDSTSGKPKKVQNPVTSEILGQWADFIIGVPTHALDYATFVRRMGESEKGFSDGVRMFEIEPIA